MQSYGSESSDNPKASSTILVAEDEPALREFTATALRDSGHAVLEAADGQEALQTLFKSSHGGSVDLLVTDIMMPKMTGTELANKAKSLFPKMKILFLTAYPQDLPISGGMAAPTIQYIQKPASMADLQRKVQEMLSGVVGESQNQQNSILVIDDEFDMVETIQDSLENEGYVVHTATNPLKAIDIHAAQWRSIKLVLLDYKMPEMYGDEVLRRLRRHNPAVEVLLISGHSHLVRDKFVGSGINCLWKPFSLDQLNRRVRVLVGAARSSS